MMRYDRRLIALAISLSALAGYVDSLGFLTLGGFFISFMSGNSTRLGIGIGQGFTPAAVTGLTIIGTFVCGVIVGAFAGHFAKSYRRPLILGLVTVLLLVSSLCSRLGLTMPALTAMILAMGAVNAMFQRNGEISIGLTYMTGALVNMGQRLAGAFLGGPKLAWLPFALLWLGLVSGVVVGTVIHARLGLHGLWIAAFYAACLMPFAYYLREQD